MLCILQSWSSSELLATALEDIETTTVNSIFTELGTTFTNLTIPGETGKCQRDLTKVSDAILTDLRFGGNNYSYQTARLYVPSSQPEHIKEELIETAWAFYRIYEEYETIVNALTTLTAQEKTDVNTRLNYLTFVIIDVILNNVRHLW